MTSEIASLIAPTGVLRAGINMGNFLLVTGRTASGDPAGVAPDMAATLAERLGVPITYVPYEKPDLLAEAADKDAWDVGCLGAEPARAKKIAFTEAYCEIEATYLVPAGSSLRRASEVDAPGKRIVVTAGTAFGLWLEANIKQASLSPVKGSDETYRRFAEDKFDALANLKPRLLQDLEAMPDVRMLEGNFTTVQQAMGVPRKSEAAVGFLRAFVDEAVTSGLVAGLIEKHKVRGLSVAGR